jgi:hypothetical protein
MTTYEFNCSQIAQLPNYTKENFGKAQKTIQSFLSSHPSKYYMMLCNDRRYYTLYTFVQDFQFKQMSKEIIDITKNLGVVKEIKVSDDDDCIMFWIMHNDEAYLYLLFNYEAGVVEI